MELKEIKGNLFTSPIKNYCQCISADFVMGAGIAVQFNSLFNTKENLIKRFGDCRTSFKSMGGLCLKDGCVYNLVTKLNVWDKPTLLTMRNALIDLKHKAAANGVNEFSIPRIGCGIDGLNWEDVKEVIRDVFKDTETKFYCYYLG